MRKSLWLMTVLALAGAGTAAFQRYKIFLPGLIGQFREPIGDYHAVTWSKGPATPSNAKRPPNIILIVADDMGMNDISLNGGDIAGEGVDTLKIIAITRQGVKFYDSYAANETC